MRRRNNVIKKHFIGMVFFAVITALFAGTALAENKPEITFRSIWMAYEVPRKMSLNELSKKIGDSDLRRIQAINYQYVAMESGGVQKGNIIFTYKKEATPLENALANAVIYGDSAFLKDTLSKTGEQKVDPNIYFEWENMSIYADSTLLPTINFATPLMVACRLGHPSIVKILLDAGADPKMRDQWGNSSIHYAAMRGSLDCMELLKDKMSAANGHKMQPVHMCAINRDIACYKFAVANGADPNALTYLQENAAHLALLRLDRPGKDNSRDFIRALEEVNFNQQDYNGNTPLHYSMTHRDYSMEIVEEVLKQGSDVNKKNNIGETALHQCVSLGNYPAHFKTQECLKPLLDKGADINSRNNELQTPLHLAAMSSDATTIDILLQEGALSSLVDKYGKLPYMYTGTPALKEKLKNQPSAQRQDIQNEIKQ